MISAEYCKTMAKYNNWQNNNLIAELSSMDESAWNQDHQVFFGSLKGTLNHLLYGDRAWLDRFQGRAVSVTDPKEVFANTIKEWIVMREALDKEILAWSSTVSDDWLLQDFNFYSYAYQKEITRPMWMLVTHFFNHQTHHRAQATSILSRLGIGYGSTDLPWLP